MKRIGNLYHLIWDIENVKLAHKNARKGKTHYKEVKMVDEDEEAYCLQISEMLKNKTFVNSKYDVFKRRDRGKERIIHKLPYFPDRIVHHAILQVLEPIWKKTLINDTYQSISGRGIHKAKKKIEPIIRSGKCKYYLKLDISKFYPSIDNTIMKEIIRKKIKCKDTLWLLDVIIDSNQGLPIGNYISQYLGNLYLTYLDHYAKEVLKIKYYFRYCDDIILLDDNKSTLHTNKNFIKDYLDNLKLDVKPNYQLSRLEEGLSFLGFRFFYHYTLIRKEIVSNFKKAINNFLRVKDNSSFSSIISYYGWVVHSSAKNLWNKLIDKAIIALVKDLNLTNKVIGVL